jgi:hypothetical protein
VLPPDPGRSQSPRAERRLTAREGPGKPQPGQTPVTNPSVAGVLSFSPGLVDPNKPGPSCGVKTVEARGEVPRLHGG